MQSVKIYADFNGIIDCSKETSKTCLALTGYGTLASLSRHQIRLCEGMVLTFYEPNDIEIEGEVFYDTKIPSKFTSPGQWVALYDSDQVRNSSESCDLDFKEHPCFKCRIDLNAYLKVVGRQYKEICPNCSTNIMFPLLPPEIKA